jgi:putative serine protease PepD
MHALRNLALLVLGVFFGVAVVAGALWLQPAAAQVLTPPLLATPVSPAPPTPPPAPSAPTASSASTPTALPTVPASSVPTATAAPAVDVRGRLQPDEQLLVDLYERVSPAVVNITNRRGQQLANGDFPRSGAGSGVIFDDQGHILTNNHVVDDASRLEVTLADGTNVSGTLVGRDPGNDLAVVKIDVAKDKLRTAPFGDSDLLKAGQFAIAIGNPFGLDRTITTGVISSTGRTRGDSGRRPIRNMIQTDAAVNPGNSGGPLLNSRGEVIGINTAIESPVRGSVGIGFAVPINTAKQFIPEMLGGAKVTHPYLGISGVQLTPARNQEIGLPPETEGTYLCSTVPNGPAAKAQLKAADCKPTGELPKGGDAIVAIDGRKIGKTDDISNYLDAKKVGDVVKLDVIRDGQRQTIDVTLGEWPEGAAPRGSSPGFDSPDDSPGVPGGPNIPGLPRIPIPGR